MTSRGRKAKGRVYQQEIVTFLTNLGFSGLKSTTMGETGTDIQDPFSILPWNYTECKRHEKSPILADIVEMMEKKTGSNGWWCFFTRQSRKQSTVVMSMETLRHLLEAYVAWHNRHLGGLE